MNKRERLGSRLGFIMLSAGCAIGCGFALPTPYTGEANTCGIYSLHYQLDIKLNSSSVKPDFVLCS